MPPSEIDAALARMHAPKPSFEAFAAQCRVLTKHFRVFPENLRLAQARKPGVGPADKLAAVLGDEAAPMLRHMVCDAYEKTGPVGAEKRLAQALQAAAETPPWDPSLVAWSYNALGDSLAALGRKDEARAVMQASWAYDPFYPGGRETAAALGVKPPKELRLAGAPDPLRLAGLNALFDDLRSERRRSIAMGVSLLWSGDNTAAAAMATVAGKATKDTGTWGPDVLAHATRLAKKTPGAAAPLPAGSPTARLRAVQTAVDAGDVATLRALALDPYRDVMLDAWTGLAIVGEGEEVRALLVEMIAASTTGRTTTAGCRDWKEALAAMPRPTTNAKVAKSPKATGGTRTTSAENEAVGLVALAITKIEKGGAHSLPRGPEKLAKPKLAPPSLVRWLAFGGLDERTPTTVARLAQRAHGKLFANLPPALAKSLAVPMHLPETCNDTVELLLLDPAFADVHGETPVLALDVSDGPAAWLTASSFGAWVAEDVGVKASPREGAARAEASDRTLGPNGVRL